MLESKTMKLWSHLLYYRGGVK